MERTPVEEQEVSRGFVLPLYNYLGPGNEGNTGLPVNELDLAAKRHDQKYEQITDEYMKTKDYEKFEKSIREADEQFISEVHRFAPSKVYDTVAKWLALGGIELKMVVEKYTGILYPKVPLDEEQAEDSIDTNTLEEGKENRSCLMKLLLKKYRKNNKHKKHHHTFKSWIEKKETLEVSKST